jgi:hypothetical protein
MKSSQVEGTALIVGEYVNCSLQLRRQGIEVPDDLTQQFITFQPRHSFHPRISSRLGRSLA